MQEVLQEALDELEFCMGSVDTPWGAKRAEYGHPEPFEITHVELGNEDWFSDNYPVRVQPLYTGLKAAYPDIIYIFSAYNENGDYTIDIPDGNMWDTHHYEGLDALYSCIRSLLISLQNHAFSSKALDSGIIGRPLTTSTTSPFSWGSIPSMVSTSRFEAHSTREPHHTTLRTPGFCTGHLREYYKY